MTYVREKTLKKHAASVLLAVAAIALLSSVVLASHLGNAYSDPVPPDVLERALRDKWEMELVCAPLTPILTGDGFVCREYTIPGH